VTTIVTKFGLGSSLDGVRPHRAKSEVRLPALPRLF